MDTGPTEGDATLTIFAEEVPLCDSGIQFASCSNAPGVFAYWATLESPDVPLDPRLNMTVESLDFLPAHKYWTAQDGPWDGEWWCDPFHAPPAPVPGVTTLQWDIYDDSERTEEFPPCVVNTLAGYDPSPDGVVVKIDNATGKVVSFVRQTTWEHGGGTSGQNETRQTGTGYRVCADE